jgi:hypothetical protein
MKPMFVLLAVGACVAPVCAQPRLAVFVHDQSSDEILRMVDLNGDGDAHDPGEVTLFFDDGPPVTGVDNAQGMVAIDPWTLMATDNFTPDNIVMLFDLDRNGDAFGPNEAIVWFDGTLPIGIAMTNPAELRRRSDGTFFLLDNNTLDTTRPEAIYILDDANGNLNIDPGEITLFHELSPVGISATTTFDVVEDNNGFVYTLDITDPSQIESIDRIDPVTGQRAEWLSSQTLFNLRGFVMGSTFELEFDPGRNEVIFGSTNLGSAQHILAARDSNGTGVIDAPAEIRVLWSESTHADGFDTGSPRDFWRSDDGRLLWTDGLRDRVMLLQDLNNDLDYNDAGETTVFFDAATATANGLPSLSLPLSLTGAPLCGADLAPPFGTLNFFDLAAYVQSYNQQDPAADLAAPFGVLNFFDVAAYIALYNAGCP